MRVLITGSNGLLGQKLVAALRVRNDMELLATSRGPDRTPEREGFQYSELDCTNVDMVDRVFDGFRPDAVIHTAAMTNVDACELDPRACQLQNVTAVGSLVQASRRSQSHFIHLSTDFVFNGSNGPYSEDDVPDPLSVYGRSKMESEKVVREAGLVHWAIARTIIVYGVAKGLSRSNVVLWAKDALENGRAIKVVDDQWRMPTLAEDLANGCIRIVERKACGIYHLCGPDLMSIHELVQRVGRFFDLDTSQVEAVKSSSLDQPARRPPRTGFDLEKARRELGYAPRHFEEGLAVLRDQLTAYGSSHE